MKTRGQQDRFLACFAGTCNLTQASRSAKVARTLHYKWLDTDPTYPVRFREAMRIAIRMLEDEAVRGAYLGERRLVTYKGKPVRDVDGRFLYETERSDNLLMFLLKAYDRKRFGDKIETTFKDWSGNLEDLPDNVLAQIAEQLNARVALEQAKQIKAPASAQTVDVTLEPLLNTRR